ncbi:MAG: GTPase [Eubacterium sp.]|nr:GTPase [Eubacterium sp.]
MFNKEQKEIPVYVFMGFLGSGKTTFAIDTLVKQEFTEGAKTLLLACEEGEIEYDEKALNEKNIYLEYIDEEKLNADYLLELGSKYKPENVMIEYNGMWELDRIFQIRVPKGWTVVQVISFVDATTFDVYVNNMKKIMMDQLRNADMIIFNRCSEETRTAEYRRSIRAVNRRGQVIFEDMQGNPIRNDDEVILPYDLDKDVIELEEEDFGIFYIDAADNPDKYVGKKIKFKAQAHRPSNYNSNEFVPGRFAMTCCADDIAFIGFKAYYGGANKLNDRDWIIVEGTIDKEFYPEFQGEGPVIKADSVSMTGPAKDDLVYFNY